MIYVFHITPQFSATFCPQVMLMVPLISSVLGKIKSISNAFEDFNKSLKELEQKSGCGLAFIDFSMGKTMADNKNIWKH